MARLAALVLVVAAACGLAPSAGAQVPDGVANCQWLRLKATAKGVELGADALGPKRSVSATCYMQLVFVADGGHGHYGAPLVCRFDGDPTHWQGSASPDEGYEGAALGDGNVIPDAGDDYLTFTNPAGDVIQGYVSDRLTIKVDKTNAFKSATFQTYSGELIDGSSYALTPAPLFGGYSVKGSSLPEAKVPPEARAVVSGGTCPPAAP